MTQPLAVAILVALPATAAVPPEPDVEALLHHLRRPQPLALGRRASSSP